MKKTTEFLYFPIELFHFYLAALRQNKHVFMSPMGHFLLHNKPLKEKDD